MPIDIHVTSPDNTKKVFSVDPAEMRPDDSLSYFKTHALNSPIQLYFTTKYHGKLFEYENDELFQPTLNKLINAARKQENLAKNYVIHVNVKVKVLSPVVNEKVNNVLEELIKYYTPSKLSIKFGFASSATSYPTLLLDLQPYVAKIFLADTIEEFEVVKKFFYGLMQERRVEKTSLDRCVNKTYARINEAIKLEMRQFEEQEPGAAAQAGMANS